MAGYSRACVRQIEFFIECIVPGDHGLSSDYSHCSAYGLEVDIHADPACASTFFVERVAAMNILRHIVEPSRLLMTWQPQDETAPSRARRVIGEVSVEPEGQMVFRYLKDTPDFEEACKVGFKGFPAFRLEELETRHGVIESLMRRLPPRKREDFSDFLAQHRLPSPFNYSDLALLGYTGARLPSDGFALVPEFPMDATAVGYLMEVAGFRHMLGADVTRLQVGGTVTFEIDTENPVDHDALAVIHQGRKIGYVNRALRATFHRWLRLRHVSATIEKLNGKSERPSVYVLISVN